MRTEDIPIFDLATTPEFVVAAGGGGDAAYGKQNGVAVIDKRRAASGDKECVFFCTEDLITAVSACAQGAQCPEIPCGEASNTETPGKDEAILIAATGEEHFYLLRFDGEFTLVSKTRVSVQRAYLKRHLLVLSGNTVHGFYDVAALPGTLSFPAKTASPADAHEEYFYKLFKKNDRLVPRREGGTADIPADWDQFFVNHGRIHKVVYQNGESTLVFRNKKHTFEGRIANVGVSNDVLVFYVIRDAFAFLHFVTDTVKIFRLPRITCMAISHTATIVSTSEGDAIVYVNGEFYGKRHLAFVPITGISIDGTTIFYSLLTGGVFCTRIHRIRYSLGFVLALLVIVAGIIFGLYRRRQP